MMQKFNRNLSRNADDDDSNVEHGMADIRLKQLNKHLLFSLFLVKLLSSCPKIRRQLDCVFYAGYRQFLKSFRAGWAPEQA